MMGLDTQDDPLPVWLTPRVCFLPQVLLGHLIDVGIGPLPALLDDRAAHNRVAPRVVFVHNADGYLWVLADVLRFEVPRDRIDDDVTSIGFYVDPDRCDLRRPIGHD